MLLVLIVLSVQQYIKQQLIPININNVPHAAPNLAATDPVDQPTSSQTRRRVEKEDNPCHKVVRPKRRRLGVNYKQLNGS